MNRWQTFFMAWIFPWVPKRLLSRCTGVVMRLPLPSFTRGVVLRLFAKAFHIDIAAAEKPLDEYRSCDAFFTRRLKWGLRPIQGDIIHPVDGKLTTRGPIQDGELLQAKGWTYGLSEFLGDARLA